MDGVDKIFDADVDVIQLDLFDDPYEDLYLSLGDLQDNFELVIELVINFLYSLNFLIFLSF